MSNVMNIIEKEEQKCDKQVLEKVIKLIEEGKNFQEIMTECNLSLFNLSMYIEVAFYKTNCDPSTLIEKDKISDILMELNNSSYPSLKAIKTKYPEYEYVEIRAVRGVYFRTKHYYQRKTKTQTEKLIPKKQTSIFDLAKSNDECKVDIYSVPFLVDCINSLKTKHWKQFAIELFSKNTPKQFFILPASMSKKVHNETELSTGKFNGNNEKQLLKMGGKYYHSYRVYQILETMLETDSAEIWNFQKTKVTNYVYGNEFKDWEIDCMKVAALSHDIYSGGTADEFDPKRKRMDINHPYYHKTELLPISNLLPKEQWEVYITIVDNHMWKWSPKEPTIKFIDGKKSKNPHEFYNLYRMVKYIELSDYLASRRNNNIVPKLKQAIETWFYIKGEITSLTWNDLDKMGIKEKEVKKEFAKGNESLQEIIKLSVGETKYQKMINESLL